MKVFARICKNLESACHLLRIRSSREVPDPRFSSVDQGQEIIRGWSREQILARCKDIDRRSMGLNPQGPASGWTILRNASSCQPTRAGDYHFLFESHFE